MKHARGYLVVFLCGAVLAGSARAQTTQRRIRLVYATPVTQAQIWEAGEATVIRRFMEANPDIAVVARQIAFESYDTQVLLSVRGGTGPDVARVNTPTLRMWAGAGYLQPLDEFISRSDVIQPADYWEGLWNFCRIDGKQWAVPLGTDCRVLFYHFGLFREAGLTGPPATWDELVAAAQRIQDKPRKRYGLAMPTNNEWNAAYDALGNFLVANGGHILNEQGTRSTAGEDPAAREAFQFLCDLITRHDVCPPGMASMSGEVVDSLFVQGRLGMLMGGPYERGNLERLNPNFQWNVHYGTAVIPAGPATGRSGSAQGGWLVAAFAQSRHPQEALRLLEFFQRPESLAIIAAVENLPPRRAAMNLGPFSDPFYKVFFDQLPTARPPFPSVPQAPNVARAVQRAYQRVVAGGATADEAIAWLDNKLTHHFLR